MSTRDLPSYCMCVAHTHEPNLSFAAWCIFENYEKKTWGRKLGERISWIIHTPHRLIIDIQINSWLVKWSQQTQQQFKVLCYYLHLANSDLLFHVKKEESTKRGSFLPLLLLHMLGSEGRTKELNWAGYYVARHLFIFFHKFFGAKSKKSIEIYAKI